MRKIMSLVILAATCGCAAAPRPETGAAICDAARAQSLVGQSAGTDIAARAQRLSGAGIVRWLQPGQIVTMEFRADRLNLVLDGQNRIEAIRCG